MDSFLHHVVFYGIFSWGFQCAIFQCWDYQEYLEQLLSFGLSSLVFTFLDQTEILPEATWWGGEPYFLRTSLKGRHTMKRSRGSCNLCHENRFWQNSMAPNDVLILVVPLVCLWTLTSLTDGTIDSGCWTVTCHFSPFWNLPTSRTDINWEMGDTNVSYPWVMQLGRLEFIESCRVHVCGSTFVDYFPIKNMCFFFL